MFFSEEDQAAYPHKNAGFYGGQSCNSYKIYLNMIFTKPGVFHRRKPRSDFFFRFHFPMASLGQFIILV